MRVLVAIGGSLALGIGLAATVQAQGVTVEGQVQGYGQPPPGYGQPSYGQPSPGQPGYAQPNGQPQYAPTYQAPPRQVSYVDQETSIKGLWIPGIIVFGVSYVLTSSLSALSFAPDYASFALIPLVGPWVMLSVPGLNEDEIAGAILGGVAQLAGVTMFLLGLTLRQTVRVAVYSFDDRDERAPRLALDVLPATAGAMFGVTVTHF